MQKTSVRSLGWKDALEEDMATYSSILAWRIPMDRGAWRATVYGVTKSWTRLSNGAYMHNVECLLSSRQHTLHTLLVKNDNSHTKNEETVAKGF